MILYTFAFMKQKSLAIGRGRQGGRFLKVYQFTF